MEKGLTSKRVIITEMQIKTFFAHILVRLNIIIIKGLVRMNIIQRNLNMIFVLYVVIKKLSVLKCVLNVGTKENVKQ